MITSDQGTHSRSDEVVFVQPEVLQEEKMAFLTQGQSLLSPPQPGERFIEEAATEEVVQQGVTTGTTKVSMGLFISAG